MKFHRPPRAYTPLGTGETVGVAPGEGSGRSEAPGASAGHSRAFQTLILTDFPDTKTARALSPNGQRGWPARYRAANRVKERVKVEVMVQAIGPMRGYVVLTPVFTYPDRRRRDDDNLATGVMKAVRDQLVRSGILEDDDVAHVRQEPARVVVERGVRRFELRMTPTQQPEEV